MRITSAGNSDTAAFCALISKGYTLSVKLKSDNKTGWYIAKLGTNEFIGDSPIETLGLIAMFDQRGEDWKPTNKEVEEFTDFEVRAYSTHE